MINHKVGTIQILIFLSCLILASLLVLIYMLANNKRIGTPSANNNSELVNQMMVQINELKQHLANQNFQQRSETQQRLDQLLQQLNNHQQHAASSLQQQYSQNINLVQDISQQLNYLQHTNQQILGFAEQMKSLERVLQNPKQRGILGEYFLDILLANVLPQAHYKMQHKFSNGQVVDAAVYFRDKIVPIDAKFSLEKYNAIVTTEQAKQRAQLTKAFVNDVKRRINETSKYIRPQEQTTDFAFMFIPAEGVYHFLISEKVGSTDLINYAFAKRIILVSPMSLYAYLETVLQGLKALEVEQSAKEVMIKLSELQKRLQNYQQYMDKIEKNLNHSLTTFQQARNEFKKIDTAILSIKRADNNTTKDKGEQSSLF